MKHKWMVSAIMAVWVNTASAQMLTDVIINTLETGPDMQVVVEERLIKEEQVKEAYGHYFPQVSSVTRLGIKRVRSPLTEHLYNNARTVKEFSLQLKAKQMLFDGYLAQAGVEKSILETKAEAARVELQAQEVALAVAKVYLDVLKHNEQMLVAEDDLARYERLANETRYKFRNHLVRESAVDMVNVQLAVARQRAQDAKMALDKSSYHFKRLVGVYPDVDTMEMPSVNETHFPTTQARALAKALIEHPAFKAAVTDVQASKADLKMMEAALLPEVSLEIDMEQGEHPNGLTGKNDMMGASIVVTHDIFVGGRKQAQRRQAMRAMHKESEMRNIVRREIEQEVKEAWDRFQALDTQVTTNREHYAALSRSRDALWHDFTQGSVPLHTWLESDEALIKAHNEKIAFQFDSLYEKLNFLSSMGILLTVLDIPLPEAANFTAETVKPWDIKLSDFRPF